MTIQEQLLDLVQACVRARSMTQAELAMRLGVSQASVSEFLSGRRSRMTVGQVQRYLDALGVRLEWSIDLVDLPPTPLRPEPV